MSLQDKIPIKKQQTTAIGGLEVYHFHPDNYSITAQDLAQHRDEYYSLAIVIYGSGSFNCDMESISMGPNNIMIVKPYQVHSLAAVSKDFEAYFISAAPFLLPDLCRDIFEHLPIANQRLSFTQGEMGNMLKMAELLHQTFQTENSYKVHIISNLLNALLMLVSSHFSPSIERNIGRQNQSFKITQKFKSLISKTSFLQSASFFADKLNITTAHLNDCVKTTTGLSVTQILQQAMLLEAKRNLYYTNAGIKEISADLGFGDHTYFSRLFKKLTNETPLAFRQKFRE